MALTKHDIDVQSVTRVFAKHLSVYRWKRASYQTVLLQQLAAMWEGHQRVLDLGAGTGVVGEAIATFLACDLTAVDVEDRFAPDLAVRVGTYDGQVLPFPNHHFDAAVINNVLHHVPVPIRCGLMREVRRVCSGPVYIKDHVSASLIDDARLVALDLIGNVPFSGMVRASYLTEAEWSDLARCAGYEERARLSGEYRSYPLSLLLPNRLEVTMKWIPEA